MSAATSAMGGGTSSGLSIVLGAGVPTESTVIVPQGQQTALVRSIDLRAGSTADGAAWPVMIFGTAFILVAVTFCLLKLRGKNPRPAPVPAASIPVPPEPRPQSVPYAA